MPRPPTAEQSELEEVEGEKKQATVYQVKGRDKQEENGMGLFIGSIIHSFSKYLMSTYYVPGTVVGTGNMKINKVYIQPLPSEGF